MSETGDEIVDDRDAGRFEATVDGVSAELTYRLDGTRLTLLHTGVPDEIGGRGIGGRLVRAAVERAVAEGLTLVPRCPFARAWLERHPQSAEGLVVDPPL